MNRNNIAAERTGGKVKKPYLTLINCSMYIHTCIESQLTHVNRVYFREYHNGGQTRS